MNNSQSCILKALYSSLFLIILIWVLLRWNIWLHAFLGLFYRSKPSLTIAPKFWGNNWKTINVNQWSIWEKKKHSTVMVQLQQNQWETTKGNGAPEKNITIPSFGKSNHRRSLSNGNCDVEAFRSYGVKELKCFSSCLVQWSWQRPCCIRCMGKSILRCSNYMNDMQWHLSSSSSAQHQTLRSWSMMWEVFAW